MRTVTLSVRILTDDPKPAADARIEMEVRRSLRLWLGPDRAYVELAEGEAESPVLPYLAGITGPIVDRVTL